MAKTLEVKNALSIQLYRSQKEMQRAALELAVAERLSTVLRKAVSHLEKKPFETLDVLIGSTKWKDIAGESVSFLTAQDLMSSETGMIGEKATNNATIYIYRSTIRGLYVRRTAHYPLSGKYSSSYALVGKETP